jgi:hypothetical protein
MDFELKSSLKVLAEIKNRALSMSFDNNLLTEVKGIEYVDLAIVSSDFFLLQIGR